MTRSALLAISLWLPASLAFAQSQDAKKVPVFDPEKSGVKVVFAPEKEKAPAPSLAAGQRAHVDSQGKLKDPELEDLQILNDQIGAQFNPAVENVFPIYGPDGTISVKLGEEFMQAITVSIGPDGKPRFQCAPAGEAKKDAAPAAPVSKSANKEAHDVK